MRITWGEWSRRSMTLILLCVMCVPHIVRGELANPNASRDEAQQAPAKGADLCAGAAGGASGPDQSQFLRAVKEDVLHRLKKNSNEVPAEWLKSLDTDLKQMRFWSGISQINRIRGQLCWWNPDVNPLVAPLDEPIETHLNRMRSTITTRVVSHNGFSDEEKRDMKAMIEKLKGTASASGSRKIKESENACMDFHKKIHTLNAAVETNQAQIASKNPLVRYIKSANPTPAEIETAKKALLADTKKAVDQIEGIKLDSTISSDAESLILMSGSVQSVLEKNPALCSGYKSVFENFKKSERYRNIVGAGLAVAGTATCIGAAYVSMGILGAACFVSTASLTAGSAERYLQVSSQASALSAGVLGNAAKVEDVLAKQREANGLLVETGLSAMGLKFGLGAGPRSLESGLVAAEQATAKRLAADATRTERTVADAAQRYESTDKAISALGRPLSSTQSEAVEAAHRVGRGQIGKDGAPAGVGNYTWAQLREKQRILKEAGFADQDIRQLMEKGVVGDLRAENVRSLWPTGRPEYDTFRASYNNGRLSDDAKYISFTSAETGGDRVAAKVLKFERGDAVVEDAFGRRYTIRGADLDSVRVSSTAKDALDPSIQFQRSYNSGELARRQGENAIISYRPDGMTQNLAAKVTSVRPDGRVEVVYASGERAVLSPSEIASAKFSGADTREAFLKAAGQNTPQVQPRSDVASLFGQQRGKQVTADAPYQAPRKVRSNGEDVQFFVRSTPEHRSTAEARGLIREYSSPGAARDLPAGDYTYLITRDGRLVVGKVEDTFELGVKHQNLANGREVVSAGELRVGADGRRQFNTLSGTYTRDILAAQYVSEPELAIRTQRALETYMGKVERNTGDLLPSRPPSTETIRWACGDRAFLGLNREACCATVRIGCH